MTVQYFQGAFQGSPGDLKFIFFFSGPSDASHNVTKATLKSRAVGILDQRQEQANPDLAFVMASVKSIIRQWNHSPSKSKSGAILSVWPRPEQAGP